MSVVVLRALGIGDLATAVPALRGLRAARPTEEIVLAAPAWLEPLARLTGAVDRVLPVDGLAVPQLPVPPPRLAVNLHGKGPRSHRLLSGTRPGQMVAFACPVADFPDGPQWTAEEHEVHRWCRMLGWYEIVAYPTDLLLHQPPIHPIAEGVTIVHPGAKDPARRWPPARFAQLVQRLAAAGHRVVVTGSPAERWLADKVAGLAGLPARQVLAGRTDVGALAGLVARARLVVSGDTGIAHLATGYRTPSVRLFGPTPPAWWGPLLDPDLHRVLWHGEQYRAPLRRGSTGGWRRPHPALDSITVDEVVAAVRDLMSQDRVDAAAPK